MNTIDQVHQHTVDNIQQYGLAVMGIFDPEGKEPSFSYTIGLTETYHHPELIMFGVRAQYCTTFFNELSFRIKAGAVLFDGMVIDDLANMPMVVKAIPRDVAAKHYTFQTEHHYAGTGLVPTYLQLVIPDKHSIFPWQPGYDDIMRRKQPELWATLH